MLSLQQALQVKKLPNLSIKLQPINPQPTHQFDCNCPICNQFLDKRMKQMLAEKVNIVNQKVKTRLRNDNILSRTNNYQWIVQKLMLPTNKIVSRGLNIFIPQTCFYKHGQIQAMYLNREINDYQLKRIPKQKINNTLLQKLFNERRRKYRDFIAVKTKKKIIVQKKSLFPVKNQPRVDTKDAAIIRYNDGSEQLVSQNKLISYFLLRKQDPFWKEISMIKNYISAGQELKTNLVLKYSSNYIAYEALYQRSKTLIQIYAEKIHKTEQQYFSEAQQQEFEKKLRQKDLQAYGFYMLYKIVNFIEYFYDEKIQKLVVKLLFNEIGQCFLLEAFKLKTNSQLKKNWTNDIYKKKIAEEQYKIFYSKTIDVTENIEKGANQIEIEMQKHYSTMKDFYGLSAVEEDNREEIANNIFFSKIHPEFKYDLTEVLRTSKLSLDKFKKVYLGISPEKKPIVKPFRSTLVKTLHKMCPKIHLASPRDMKDDQKYSPNTNRAFSSGNTTQRLNKSLKATVSTRLNFTQRKIDS